MSIVAEKTIKALLTPQERAARRAERRAKQREANVGRALKMHTRRLAFEADRNQPGGPRDASATERPKPPRLNVGCSGWFYWDWRNRFYPPGMATKEWFGHYAGQFDTVELNAPFYSWPTVATVESWIRQAKGRPFFYTVKVCELITHLKRFSRSKELVKDFGFIGQLLRAHMGCFLFQLPPSFSYTAARLKRVLDQLDPQHRNVVEFRHRSWWNPQTFAAFKKTKTIFCSVSAPRLPDELVQTSEEVYLRFHGTKRWYRHDYTADELRVWTKRIDEIRPGRVWAYFNNDYDGYAIKNARVLLRQLKAGWRRTATNRENPTTGQAHS